MPHDPFQGPSTSALSATAQVQPSTLPPRDPHLRTDRTIPPSALTTQITADYGRRRSADCSAPTVHVTRPPRSSASRRRSSSSSLSSSFLSKSIEGHNQVGSPPDKIAGLSSQRQLRRLEKLASRHLHQADIVAAQQQSSSSSKAESHHTSLASLLVTSSKSANLAVPSSLPPHPNRPEPSLYKASRGRSANVSPSRGWEARRGSSANVISGASGSGSGEESEITIAPPDLPLAKRTEYRDGTTLPQRSATARARSSGRSRSRNYLGVSRSPRTSLLGSNVDPEDQADLTSSDEEGADASRYARSRRASLERDRRKGMQILLAASLKGRPSKGGAPSTTTPSPDALDQINPYEGLTSASNSTSATPTTMGDDQSEKSSILSRTSSTETFNSSTAAQSSMRETLQPRRSRLMSNEGAEAAFFGLADDESEASAAQLSTQVLSAALSRRRSRSRVQSAHAELPRDKSRSMPGSRRPSHPESSCLAPPASTSVPHRPTTILGFAPVSSSSPIAHHYGTSPRRFRQQMAALAIVSKRAAGQHDDEIDLLSGTSVGSIEDMIKVDQVEWANDELTRRRPSLVSLKAMENVSKSTGGGEPTVAAVEAKSLLLTDSDEGGSSTAKALLSSRPTSKPLPTSSSSNSLVDNEQEAARESGFAQAYQERLSSLQGQLRLWVASESANGAHSSAVSDETHQSGLLANSWRQISRLPNLLFPGKGKEASVSDQANKAASLEARLEAQRRPSTSSFTSEGPRSPTSNDTVSIASCEIDDGSPRRSAKETSTPNFSSRGVIDPLEGDRDPGAYISGLGQRIDPDVELASVVHLQSFRSRGRSVDARNTRSPIKSLNLQNERKVASDSEQSPLMLPVEDPVAGGIPPLPLSPKASESGNVLSAPSKVATAPTSPLTSSAPTVRVRPRFTLHDAEDIEKDNCGADQAPTTELHESAQSQLTKNPLVSKPARRGGVEVDEDGFTIVRRSRSPRCARPAADPLVPQNYSAFGNGAATSSEDSDADLSRTESESGPGEHRSESEDTDALTPIQGRRGRGRGREDRSSRGNSPQTSAATRSRQCAIGLFSAKSGRRDEERSDSVAAGDLTAQAIRSVRSSPNLSYARVAASQPVGAASTEERASRDSRVGSKGILSRPAGPVRRSSGDGQERQGRGRGRADSVKVTSSSFGPSEHPPNSLQRSASVSSLDSLARRQTIMSIAALGTASYALPPPQPSGPSVPAFLPQTCQAGSAGTTSSSSSHSGTSWSPHSSPGASAPAHPQMVAPTRPTLLSNSAHLLMLSLELEMMRAQKISAPLKVRWARQRVPSPLPSPVMAATSSATPSDTALLGSPTLAGQVGEQGCDIVAPAAVDIGMPASADLDASEAPAGSSACSDTTPETAYDDDQKQDQSAPATVSYTYAYRPHKGSNLRHVVNA